MRRSGLRTFWTVMGISLALLGAVSALPASALPESTGQDASSFQDVPTSHWAYLAVTDLQRQGVITGYPEGYFLGKRTLTRYEFAIALKRALDRLPLSALMEAGSDAANALQVTPDEVRQIRRLVVEFQGDLTQLGETSRDLETCYAALERAVVRSRAPLPLPVQIPTLFPSGASHGVSLPLPHAAQKIGVSPTGASASTQSPSLLRSLSLLTSGDTTPTSGAPSGFTLPLLGSRFALSDMATAPDAGLRLDMPLFRTGEVGLTLGQVTALSPHDAAPRSALAYGTDLQFHARGRLTLGAAMTRTLMSPITTPGDALAAIDNDTYRIHIGYKSGPANAILGYQVVDPLPSNLANVQGPYTRLSYQFSNSLRSYLGGDYYTSGNARSMSADSVTNSLLTGNIYRGTAGIRWSPTRGLSLSADYEGVLYDLSGTLSASGRRALPIEQYITLGAGLNLSRNAILKLAYQIANQQDGMSDDGTNTSVFTTQFAIHF